MPSERPPSRLFDVCGVHRVGWPRAVPVVVLTLSLALPCFTQATTDVLEATIQEQKAIAQEAADSQHRVDESFAATRQLLEDYRLQVRELENLRQYNDHVATMTERQAESIGSLEAELDAVQVTEHDILPLMTGMIDALARFLELDVPFLIAERRDRVQDLRDMIDSPDISLGEKYRRVLEAYQIETEYGRTVEAYRGTRPIGDQERTVDFLRLGRVALLYRSLGGTDTGFWDKSDRAWRPLPEGYRGALEKGLRVAQKQSAPELLRVPVSAPEVLR